MSSYYLKIFWFVLCAVLVYSPQANSYLKGEMDNQLQALQADRDRVPQVEFLAENWTGTTILKETDYIGEGQFPLVFTRYYSSPGNYKCGKEGWAHSYTSCLSIRYNRWPTDYQGVTVCTLGSCTAFDDDAGTVEMDLKPRIASIRDTLVRNGNINGSSYPWVYIQFVSGIREAYGEDGKLIARFDRSGIEHRLKYNDQSGRLNSVTHIPSGRKLGFSHVKNDATDEFVTKMTIPSLAEYTYQWQGETSSTITFPPALPGAERLVRKYTFKSTNSNGSCPFLLSMITESDKILLTREPYDKNIGNCNMAVNGAYTPIYPNGYGKISLPGHNVQDVTFKRDFIVGLPSNRIYQVTLTQGFADTDISEYSSLSVDRSFVNSNNGSYGWSEFEGGVVGNVIFRPSLVSQRCANCPGDFANYTYDPNKGDLLTRTDYLGYVTKFTNDARGLPLTEVEAFGTEQSRSTVYTWDKRFTLKTSETRGGVKKEWQYNDRGHLTKEIVHPSSEKHWLIRPKPTSAIALQAPPPAIRLHWLTFMTQPLLSLQK